MKRIGIGILSHAHGHVMAYSRVLQKMEGVELVAAWDDNEERGRAAADTYGYALRPSPEEVVEDPSIDAVIVTSETNRHAGHVELAATAGKHILCQKPMATTLEDCDRIIAAVRRSGVKFSMAYQMRQDPVNQKIRELLAEGAVGKVAVVRRRHCIGVLLNPGFVNGPSRWHFDAEANVGMFFDDANHPADWYYWVFGRPTSVTATIDRIVSDIPTDDSGVAVYRFGGGVIGVLYNGSTTVAGVNTTEIDGDEGTLIQDYGDGPSTAAPRPPGAVPLRLLRRGDSEWTTFDLPIPASQGDRISAIPAPWVAYLRGETDVHVSAEEGRVSVEMVLGAYISAKEGRRVDFPL